MSIVATDMKFYGSANMPEADGATTGGDIDLTTRVVFDSATLANAPAGIVKAVSSSGADTTQTLTVTGRNAGGSIVTSALALNGTNVITGIVSFERILKMVLSGTCAGSVTVKDNADATIAIMEPGLLTIRRPFYNVSADIATGSQRIFYEKVFLKNTHATLSLLSANVALSADPSSIVTFGLSNAVNDSASVANRQTAPAGGVLSEAISDSSKNVPGTDLAAASRIGTWIALTLAAGASATKTTFTFTVTGSSI